MDFCQVILIDDIMEENIIFLLQQFFQDEYTKIKEAFENSKNMLAMLKNMIVISKYK